MREAANPIYTPPALGPNDKVSGWVGTPDPSKFAPGTNSLTPEEVRMRGRMHAGYWYSDVHVFWDSYGTVRDSNGIDRTSMHPQ